MIELRIQTSAFGDDDVTTSPMIDRPTGITLGHPYRVQLQGSSLERIAGIPRKTFAAIWIDFGKSSRRQNPMTGSRLRIMHQRTNASPLAEIR